MAVKAHYDHIIKLTLLVIFSIIISLLSGEILVRLFSKTGYLTPEILKSKSLQYERSIFARNIFAQKEQKTKGENNADVYVNKLGYRGKEFSVNKPAGIIRIMFYGGSSVFDITVSEEKDWPHLVEKNLKEKGITNVEVINAGVPGNKSNEAWGRLFAEGHIFSPDYVVLSNQYNDLKYFRSQDSLLRYYAQMPEIEDPFITYQNGLDRFLSELSQLYVRVRTKYFLIKYKPNLEGAEPPGEFTDKITDLGLKQYKLSLEMFVDLACNIGSVPILMTEPRLFTKDNENNPKLHYRSVKLTHDALYDAFVRSDEIIKSVGKEKNVYVIDAASLISGKDELFVDNVHTNEKGSKEIANLVSNAFATILK